MQHNGLKRTRWVLTSPAFSSLQFPGVVAIVQASSLMALERDPAWANCWGFCHCIIISASRRYRQDHDQNIAGCHQTSAAMRGAELLFVREEWKFQS